MEAVDWAGVDVLLTDLELPGASGVALIARARAANPRLLALPLTIHDEADLLYAAIEAGATGYVLKGDGPAAMLRSVHDVVHGLSPMSPAIGRHLIKAFRRPTLDGRTSDLSARELEILALVASGQTSKEVAQGLGLSLFTINAHLRNVYAKLHVNRRSEALRKARLLGYLERPTP